MNRGPSHAQGRVTHRGARDRPQGRLPTLTTPCLGHRMIHKGTIRAAAEDMEARHLAVAVATKEFDEGAIIARRRLGALKEPSDRIDEVIHGFSIRSFQLSFRNPQSRVGLDVDAFHQEEL